MLKGFKEKEPKQHVRGFSRRRSQSNMLKGLQGEEAKATCWRVFKEKEPKQHVKGFARRRGQSNMLKGFQGEGIKATC
mgnify:CR=1 FL=1